MESFTGYLPELPGHPVLGKVLLRMQFDPTSGLDRIAGKAQFTPRWEGGRDPRYPITESVYDHTASGISRIFRLKHDGLRPHLAKIIDYDDVVDMWVVHDWAENSTGDETITADKKMSKQTKYQKEMQAYMTDILPQLAPQYRADCLNLFLRYENRDAALKRKTRSGNIFYDETPDIEAMFAKLIDVIDGNAMALERMYRIVPPNESTPEEQEEVRRFSLHPILSLSERLVYALRISGRGNQSLLTKSVDELRSLVTRELKQYGRYGYQAQVEEYLAQPPYQSYVGHMRQLGILFFN